MALPAGWYTDPGQSGGKRWWDGVTWTEHLKLPDKAATPTTGPQSVPYGLGTVHQPGYVPMTNTSNYPSSVPSRVVPISNKSAWLSLLFGVVAVGLTLVSFLPGSSELWISGAGVIALLWGILAIANRVRDRATNSWAPVLGVLLGLGATVIAVLGVDPVALVNGTAGGLLPASSTTAAALANAPLRDSAEPFVFNANPLLTQDGVAVQKIATALNESYASGHSTLAAGQSWPQSLRFTNTQVLSDSGKPLATIAQGHYFSYALSADKKSYTFSVTTAAHIESATYDSATNRFTFTCPSTDTTCVPAR